MMKAQFLQTTILFSTLGYSKLLHLLSPKYTNLVKGWINLFYLLLFKYGAIFKEGDEEENMCKTYREIQSSNNTY